MSAKDKNLQQSSSRTEIERFLNKVAATTARRTVGDKGRLVFALDATASREPTWDRACHIQGQMFEQTAALGGLEIQLCYYRGYAEFNASPWLSDTQKLLARMTGVFCLGGRTQIEKVLCHTLRETKKRRVNALVFVGDCMEESVDRLSELAGELGILGVPAFIFHEGYDPIAERAFQQIARLSHGACCRFDSNSAEQLKDLLSAVAVYAAGGRRALEDFSHGKGGIIKQLSHKVNK